MPVFGVLLEKLPRKNGVPSIVSDLISYLTEKEARIEAEGIFRIPGRKDDMELIKNKYNRGEPVDLTKYDVHTVAGVLKMFFRDLKDSLVTRENTDMIVATVEMTEEFHAQKIKNIKTILTFVQPVYYETLKLLIHYLKLIADKSDINKMNVNNISVIFSVNIFACTSATDIISQQNSQYFCCTKFFIDFYDEIFDGPSPVPVNDKPKEIKTQRIPPPTPPSHGSNETRPRSASGLSVPTKKLPTPPQKPSQPAPPVRPASKSIGSVNKGSGLSFGEVSTDTQRKNQSPSKRNPGVPSHRDIQDEFAVQEVVLESKVPPTLPPKPKRPPPPKHQPSNGSN